MRDRDGLRVLIGITGGQGVGKSTFAKKLADHLAQRAIVPVRLVPSSLSAEMTRLGFEFGSASSAQTVFAIYAYHLKRQRELDSGISVLDRCSIDAIAYVRCLAVNSEIEKILLEEISAELTNSLRFVVQLEMDGIFKDTKATHEDETLRRGVASSIQEIVKGLKIPSITVNAADDSALARTIDAVQGLTST